MKTSTPSLIRRRPQRDLDAIYQRHEQRQRGRQDSFAPDFMHGTFMLSELYESAAGAWVESAAFVECLLDERGELLGYTVATFQDYFLTIEHGLVGEVAQLNVWLAQRTRDRRVLVELQVVEAGCAPEPGAGQLGARSHHVPIRCSQERLALLEREHLHVTRDIDEQPRSLMTPEALARQAQTDVLSLIGLCARLMHDPAVLDNAA